MADQLKVGEVMGRKRMGGPFFPLIDKLFGKVAWASMTEDAANKIINGAVKSDYTVVYNMSTTAIDSNVALTETFEDLIQSLPKNKQKEIFSAIQEQVQKNKYGNKTDQVRSIAKSSNTLSEFFTELDKLDVDDDMSRIVDNTVENGFMQTMAKTIEKENDTKPLESDFNMNAQMVNYLKRQYNQRTISGIQESNIYNKHKKMKNESLKKLIKEEIKNFLEIETPPTTKEATEVKKLTDYLIGVGKTALTQINKPEELDSVLNAIFNGMNPAFQKNAKAVAIKKVIDMKLSA
jgi:hypothetical protein